jgi:hypothetical protein
LEANLALPGVHTSPEDGETDVRVHLKDGAGFPSFAGVDAKQQEVYVSENSDARGRPIVRVLSFDGGEYFGFFYYDDARFIVDRAGREIWADWPDTSYTLEDAATYLMGPVIGFVLRLRGVLPLHASAVALGDCAIAIAAGPGAGKSTTAAGFARLGHAVLSDDLAALRERGDDFLVQPGYPRVNVWPDSARNLFGAEDSLAPISPTWDKRYLPLDQNGLRFEQRALPLRAIYLLDDRDAALKSPQITEVEGMPALLNLIANTYVNYLIDPQMRQREFSTLGRLLARTPVRNVRPPADPARLRNLCEAIRDDAAGVIQSRKAAQRMSRGGTR